MSPRTTQLDVCVAALTCATVRGADREQMVGIEPPVWVEATVSEESLTHIVWVEWFGRRLVVDGVHLGPEPGDFDWSHEASNPERHWNLEWMTAVDEDEDPDELPAELLERLPSHEAWQRTGEWLLGTLMAARLERAQLSSEEFTAGIADTWERFAAGFAGR